MTFKCEKCEWRGSEEELRYTKDFHRHPDTDAVLSDNSFVECPLCGGDVIEED